VPNNLSPPLRTFVKSGVPHVEVFKQILRHRPGSQMLNENLHWGLVGERAILLVESEMRWVQMDNE
jgi:hypothetical protein